ncbi:MAG: hypothetical protein ACOCZE_03935, partial [Planctomycetota bacterium]
MFQTTVNLVKILTEFLTGGLVLPPAVVEISKGFQMNRPNFVRKAASGIYRQPTAIGVENDVIADYKRSGHRDILPWVEKLSRVDPLRT